MGAYETFIYCNINIKINAKNNIISYNEGKMYLMCCVNTAKYVPL